MNEIIAYGSTHLLVVAIIAIVVILLIMVRGNFVRNLPRWILRTIFRDIIWQIVRVAMRSVGIR